MYLPICLWGWISRLAIFTIILHNYNIGRIKKNPFTYIRTLYTTWLGSWGWQSSPVGVIKICMYLPTCQYPGNCWRTRYRKFPFFCEQTIKFQKSFKNKILTKKFSPSIGLVADSVSGKNQPLPSVKFSIALISKHWRLKISSNIQTSWKNGVRWSYHWSFKRIHMYIHRYRGTTIRCYKNEIKNIPM
jgi:hypothetical protein